MAAPLKPDICVIGAGSAGLSLAAAAAAFGVGVVLVERGQMGGDCLNSGCVPSKALLAAASRAALVRTAPSFGIGTSEPAVNFGRVHRHVADVVAAIAPNDSAARFAALGVRVLEGSARFRDPRTVLVGEQEIVARRFVIATGSSPVIPPIPGLDAVPFLTNETIFGLTRRPAHLVVVGAGPMGVELAQAHRRLGSAVTLIDSARLLPREDPELAAVVARSLRRDGVAIREHAVIDRVERRGAGLRVHLDTGDGGEAVDGSHLLLAAGRRPDLDGLDLDAAGIAREDGRIRLKRGGLRTSNRRVYVIGDAAGGLQFTHAANHQAGLVLKALLFRLPARYDPLLVPRVTFSNPELAAVGLDEAAARKAFRTVNVVRWPFAENDRARAGRETAGFVKVVATRRGRILGASIVGEDAGEAIHLWSLALSRKMKLSHIAFYVAPYPTRGEIGRRAAIAYFSGLARNGTLRAVVRFLRAFG